jgi:hypothetical protein
MAKLNCDLLCNEWATALVNTNLENRIRMREYIDLSPSDNPHEKDHEQLSQDGERIYI